MVLKNKILGPGIRSELIVFSFLKLKQIKAQVPTTFLHRVGLGNFIQTLSDPWIGFELVIWVIYTISLLSVG